MAEMAASDAERSRKKSIEGVREYGRWIESRRLSDLPLSGKGVTGPRISYEHLDYLRMKLDGLPPNEYLDTSRDVYEQASAVQSAYQAGQQDARTEHDKREKRDEEMKKRTAALHAQFNG